MEGNDDAQLTLARDKINAFEADPSATDKNYCYPMERELTAEGEKKKKIHPSERL